MRRYEVAGDHGIIYTFIHSLPVTVYPLQGRGGGLKPILADIKRGHGASWTSRWFITGLTYRDKQKFMPIFTPTGNLERSPINMHVFGQWEEAGVSGKNPCTHRKNM